MITHTSSAHKAHLSYHVVTCTLHFTELCTVISYVFLHLQQVPCVDNPVTMSYLCVTFITRIWANAQSDGRPAEHRWRPLFNVAKFG